MTINEKNDRYKSAKDMPFERRRGKSAAELHRRRGKPMECHSFYLRPVLRNPPDIERLGRAIIELALRSPDQKADEKQG